MSERFDELRDVLTSSGEKRLQAAAGVWKSTILDFITRQCFYKASFREDDPYFLLRWRESEHRVNEYHQRAATLCRFGIVMEYYGLSYMDLMDLDFETFEQIESEVKQIAADRAKVGKNNETQMAKLMQAQPKLPE